jgi:hypothetical protein
VKWDGGAHEVPQVWGRLRGRLEDGDTIVGSVGAMKSDHFSPIFMMVWGMGELLGQPHSLAPELRYLRIHCLLRADLPAGIEIPVRVQKPLATGMTSYHKNW